MRRGLFDWRFAAHHRRERQRRFVGHAEGNVQIAQPDIEVNRQDAEAVRARQAAIPAQRDVFPVPPFPEINDTI